MTIQFPDFPSDPAPGSEWYNTVTKRYYDWNDQTQAWRLRPLEEGGGPLIPDPNIDGHQDGTLDDRYVEVGGDTMEGDLIQLPSEDIFPSNEGELATAVPGGTDIEFRYMNSSGNVVCGSIPLSNCGKEVNPVIAIDGGGGVFADYGEDLILVSDGTYPEATLADQVWEYTADSGVTWVTSSASTPPDPHTVVTEDRGRLYRVAQNFIDDKDGSAYTLYSNSISVTDDPPPIDSWIGWTHSGGYAKVTVSKFAGQASAPAALYKNDGGTWVEVEDVGISSSNLLAGTYIIQADNLRGINWMRSQSGISLTLDSRSHTEDLQTMANAFQSLTKFNQDLNGFDWSSVTDWSDTFVGCSSFNGNMAGVVGSQVTTIARMFKNSGFDQPVSSWDVTGVIHMNGLFEGSPFNQSLAGWDTSNVERFDAMFMKTSAFNQDVNGLNITSATNMSAMFRDAEAFNQPISSWTFPAGCNVAGMFAKTHVFNSALTFNTSGLTSLKEMFLDAKVFNHPSIDGWDVSNVTDLSQTFKGSVFNQDLNSWNTSSVKTLDKTWADAKVFNGDITNWNVSNCESFASTFYYCEKFNKNLNNWNTSSGTNMSQTFYRAREYNQPMDRWATALVSNMDSMFSGCWKFYQDISSWCVPLISPPGPTNFVSGSNDPLQNHPERLPQWGTCPPRILTNPVIK